VVVVVEVEVDCSIDSWDLVSFQQEGETEVKGIVLRWGSPQIIPPVNDEEVKGMFVMLFVKVKGVNVMGENGPSSEVFRGDAEVVSEGLSKK